MGTAPCPTGYAYTCWNASGGAKNTLLGVGFLDYVVEEDCFYCWLQESVNHLIRRQNRRLEFNAVTLRLPFVRSIRRRRGPPDPLQ